MKTTESITSRSRLRATAAVTVTGIAALATIMCNLAPPTSAQSAATTPPKVVSPGQTLFLSECSMCHQANRKGSAPEYPSLIGVSARFSDQELTETIQQGLPRMPAFPNLKPAQVNAIVEYLKSPETAPSK